MRTPLKFSFSELATSRAERPLADSTTLTVGAVRWSRVAEDRQSAVLGIVLTNGRRYQLEVPADLLRPFARLCEELDAGGGDAVAVPSLVQENR